MATPVISGQNMVRVGNLATDPLYVTVVGGSISVSIDADVTTAAPGGTATGLVVRVAGSLPVAISSIVPVTAQTSVSVSGLPVYFAPGALIAASTALSITGVSIGAVVSGVVSVSVLPAVSISVSAVLGTIITVVALPAISISVSAVLGTIITILGTQIVTIATAASITVLDVGRTMVNIQVSSTAPGNALMLLFTVYVGTAQAPTFAGTSLFAIPAGKTFRIVDVQGVVAGSAVVGINGLAFAVFATSAATVTVSIIGGRAAMLGFAATALLYSAFDAQPNADIGAGQTLGIGITLNTSCLIGALNFQGYLFP